MKEPRIPQDDSSTPPPDGFPKEPSGGGRLALRKAFAALLRPLPLITLGLAVVFCALLLLLLRTPEPQTEAERPAPPAPRTDPSVIRSQALPQGSEFSPEGSLEADIRTVDQALIKVLRARNIDPSEIEFLDVHREEGNGEPFTLQTLRLPKGISSIELFEALCSELHPERFSVLSETGGRMFVTVNGVTTHSFLDVPLPFLPSREGPKLVVVIDDLGENLTLARELAALPIPVVFAIWPNSSHAAEVRKLAREHGKEVLVHLPMEPLGYPKDNPGKQALFASMSDEELDRTIQANLDKVPEAVGVNNHMGSRFTSDARGMGRLMRILKQRGLFFLDSRTTGKSVGHASARTVGLPYFGRDVFLDNSLALPDIMLQLRKAERLALRNGVAIAIGHPHPATVQTLRNWLRGHPSVTVSPLTALPPQ
ncbi:MAG: divergent polysaccharide deacetylase family protein [Desulfovibrio sp.]